MVHAYMVRADEEALAHGERLLRLYPDEAKQEDFRQATQIVEGLKRRKRKGTFGKAPAEAWPDGFTEWDAKRKLTYLIDELEEVDARQIGQPGGVNLVSDRRVAELIHLGDEAVPTLIEALDNDKRLTRSVHFFRTYMRYRTVLSVREAVLTALMSILRVRLYQPPGTGDNFTMGGDEAAKQMAKRLRQYWKENGHLAFDERMMKVLTDPKATIEAKREAAENVATQTADRRLGTTVWSDRLGAVSPNKPNPAVLKFSKPTAAEAILATMDADLKAHEAKQSDSGHEYEGYRLEDLYIDALVDLGDKRLAAEAARLSQAADTVRLRRKWAYAAHWLGDPEPFKKFAADLFSTYPI
jgi:hypothetical protein